MSFGGGSMGGFGGAEEVLAYMIKAYDMATPVFKAFGAEVTATTKQIQGALLELNKSLATTDKAIRDQAVAVGTSEKEIQAAYDATGAKSVELAKMQADLAKKSAAAADAQVAASKKIGTAQNEQAAAAESAVTRSSGALARYGRDMLVGAAGAAAVSLDLATKFQANTLRMETQAGATAKGLDQIRLGLLKMSGQVGVTPEQLANGMYHIVSSMNAVLPASTRVTQELQIMKIAAEGAQVGHSNLEETTYALASAMNALHLQANSAARVMGDLNAIVGSGDMTMTDLVNALKSGLIPAAQTFGISLQSVGAALSVMGDMGMRGAIAGTRLRMAISLLAAPTKQAAGILETLGMSTKQALASTERMSELLQKAGINVTTLSNDLRKPDGLQVALEDLDAHLKSNGLSADAAGAAIDRAFGGGRMGATIKLLAENTDRLKLKFDQINTSQGQFGHDWQLTAQSFRVEVDKALASLEAFAITMGDKLMPYATEALKDLEDLANWFAKNKTALDALIVTVGTFATVAIGNYLIGKVKEAVGLVKDFAGSLASVGHFMGFGGGAVIGPETKSPLTQAQLEQSLGRVGPTPTLSSELTSAASGMWGISGTQIRVGTLMNPLAVVLASGFAGGAAGGALGGGGLGIAPGGGPVTPTTASDKAAKSALDQELSKLEEALGVGSVAAGPVIQNAAGRYQIPAGGLGGLPGGRLVSEGQANTLNTIAGSDPGLAALAEEKALAQEPAIRLPQITTATIGGDYAKQIQGEETRLTSLFDRGLGAAESGLGQLSLLGSVPMGGPGRLTERAVVPHGTGSPFEGISPMGWMGNVLPSAEGVKGFVSDMGGRLMRGGMVGGMGLMASQLAGTIIPGQAGKDVAKIGSYASGGAALGSIVEPGVGTLVGAIGGGIIGALTTFFNSPSFGQNLASGLDRGAHHPSFTASTQAQVAQAIDKMAHIVHPGTTTTDIATGAPGSRAPTSVIRTINVPFAEMSVDQQAQYMAQAKIAGSGIAKQLEAGWSQYKFQSEPVMFEQIKTELAGMPPAVQGFGASSAIAFAEGLTKQGKLPAKAADEMLAQFETAFPGMVKYMGLEGDAGIQQFNKALDFRHSQDSVQNLLDSFRSDFPQVTAAMDSAGADIGHQSAAVAQALRGIIDGPDSTKAMREAATADLKALQQQTVTTFTNMAGLVDVQSKTMAASVKAGSANAAQTATQNFDEIQTAIDNAMKAGEITATKGFQIIAQTTLQAIQMFGGSTKGISVASLAHSQAINQLYSQGKTGVAGALTAAAVGGKIHTPTYMVGEEGPTHPEYVLATNPAYRSRNLGLWAQYAKEVGIPGFAQGGYIDPIPGYSISQTDMGVDANAAVGTPILAFGPSKMVGYQSNWYQGQPEMVFQLTGGPDTGRFWYAAEQITPLAHIGQTIPQGGIVARYAKSGTGIEIGWAANAGGTTLAQATTGHPSDNGPTPAGTAFRTAILNLPIGKGVGLGAFAPTTINAPQVQGGGMVGQIVQAALNLGAATATASLGGAVSPGPGTAGIPSGSWQAAADTIAKQKGWDASQVNAWWGVEQLEDSSLSLTARNPTSTAIGLAQFLGGPAEYAKYGGSYGTLPGEMIAMANYMAQRYGTPAGALAHERAFHWYAQGGRIPAFGQGGAMTANSPTLAMFGENGPETAFFVPHFATGGVPGPIHYTSSVSTTGTPYIQGTDTVTPHTTVSYSATGQETIHTSESIRPTKVKSTTYTVGFNPMTDAIESHDATEWRSIHAVYAKQRADAAAAKKAYDAWLAVTVTDMLTIGGEAAGVIDLTRRTAVKEKLPTGGQNFGLTRGNLGGVTDQGFKQVLTGLDRYLKIAPLSDAINLLAREMKQGSTTPTTRLGQVDTALITAVAAGVKTAFTNQQSQFTHQTTVAGLLGGLPAGTTQRSLGLSNTQMKALGLRRGQVSALSDDTGGPASVKAQIDQLSNQVIPAYKADAAQTTVAYKAALKSHNKKLAATLLSNLDQISQAELQAQSDKQKAQTAYVESIYQKGQTAASSYQSNADIATAIGGMAAGTNLAAIGLGQFAGLQSAVGGKNPMLLAQYANSQLGLERGSDVTTLNQLIAQLPSLKGSALDTANQHIKDLSQSIASLTTEMNTNLMNAIKQVAQGFQDQADTAGAANDLLGAIGDIPTSTDLSSLGFTSATLAALGINPATAATIQGFGPQSIQGYMDLQGGVLTPSQIAGATAYYGAQNTGIQNELGNASSGLVGEFNYEVSQIPSVPQDQMAGFLQGIMSLGKTIAGLSTTMQDNTNAVTKLTLATNAATNMTGQMTGAVGYSYQGQDFMAYGSGGISSDQTVDIGQVGS